MDHRIIPVNELALYVLLDRLETDTTWEVMISTYVSTTFRFDEWVNFENPDAARQFIIDFSDASARQFLTRAVLKGQELKPVATN